MREHRIGNTLHKGAPGARGRRTGERAKSWVAGVAIVAGGALLVSWAAFAGSAWAEQYIFPSYCATSAPGWIVARSVRPFMAGLGVAAMLAAPKAARAFGRARLRVPSIGAVASIAVAVAASVAVCEVYMRHLHERLTNGMESMSSASRRPSPMTHADSRLGWSYFPSRTTWAEVGGRQIAYTIDAHGDRASSIDHRLDPGRATILFAGESITFGYGLRFEETVPFLVGRDLGLQTVNLAVIGYGSDQAYLRVLEAFDRIPHPLAIVTLFVPDQIKRNVDSWRPRLAFDASGALEIVPPSRGPRIAKLLEELPWHGDDALRITAAILRKTAEAARSRGAFPLFVVTNYGSPCVRDDDGEAWIVKELFVRQGLPFVRVDMGPEERPGAFEMHPSPRGARKLAAAVERALADLVGTRPRDPASVERAP